MNTNKPYIGSVDVAIASVFEKINFQLSYIEIVEMVKSV